MEAIRNLFLALAAMQKPSKQASSASNSKEKESNEDNKSATSASQTQSPSSSSSSSSSSDSPDLPSQKAEEDSNELEAQAEAPRKAEESARLPPILAVDFGSFSVLEDEKCAPADLRSPLTMRAHHSKAIREAVAAVEESRAALGIDAESIHVALDALARVSSNANDSSMQCAGSLLVQAAVIACKSGLSTSVVSGRDASGVGGDLGSSRFVGEQQPDGSVRVEHLLSGESVSTSVSRIQSQSSETKAEDTAQDEIPGLHSARLRVGPYPLHPEVARDVQALVATDISIDRPGAKKDNGSSSPGLTDQAGAGDGKQSNSKETSPIAPEIKAAHAIAAMAWRYSGGHPGEMLLLLRICEAIVRKQQEEDVATGKATSTKQRSGKYWRGQSPTDKALLLVDSAWEQLVDVRRKQLIALFQGAMDSDAVSLPGAASAGNAQTVGDAVVFSANDGGIIPPHLSLSDLVETYACLSAITGYKRAASIPQV